MGERRRVQDDRDSSVGSLMQPADQLSLVVRLPDVSVEAQFGTGRSAYFGELSERHAPVDLRLARTETVEIGAIEHEHLHVQSLLPGADNGLLTQCFVGPDEKCRIRPLPGDR